MLSCFIPRAAANFTFMKMFSSIQSFAGSRGPWPKALGVVCGYIDKGFRDPTSQFPQAESYTDYSELGPTKRSRVDKLLQLRDQLQRELNRPSGPTYVGRWRLTEGPPPRRKGGHN